ncbi:LuxR C-terminal-related transcriptional regulator [Streptomyces sp. NPDC004069]|uniref:LuxR C-terminal-related transcriptional regulator n=1 Tax=Streptomyces sp. NPDC052043 TaxID=3365684 RepID=UPI0037CCFD9B
MTRHLFDTNAIRVALVQRDPLLRRDTRAALSANGIDVITETGELDRAVPLITASFPDVVVLDLDWQGTNALEMCGLLTGKVGVRGILAMTRRCEDSMLLRSALAAGVRGYLAKSAEAAEVVGAVRALAGGSVVVGHAAARLVARLLRNTTPPLESTMMSVLTRRELEVLELIARGYDNRRIARSLTLADKTVRNHVSAIFGKLDVQSRAQAVVRAREAGFGLTR